MRKNLTARLSPTRAHWAGLRAELSSRARGFRQSRAPLLQREMEQDFSLLLMAWGMEEADLPLVLRDLRLRCLALLAPPLLALLALYLDYASVLALGLITPPCLLGLLSSLWRISILHRRSFTPFLRWLLNQGAI